MQGEKKIIELLNEILTGQLTAINQYFIHYKMLQNWGFDRLAKKKYSESIRQMKHADDLMERILYLEGIPNMQRLNPVKVGETATEMHQLDLAVETTMVKALNRGIEVTVNSGDNGTRTLLDKVLTKDEDSLDWHESHLEMIERLGEKAYLAEMIHD